MKSSKQTESRIPEFEEYENYYLDNMFNNYEIQVKLFQKFCIFSFMFYTYGIPNQGVLIHHLPMISKVPVVVNMACQSIQYDLAYGIVERDERETYLRFVVEGPSTISGTCILSGCYIIS